MSVLPRFLPRPKIVLTRATLEGLVLDLSPCEKLVEIHAVLPCAKFTLTIATLRTVSSHRFRKLVLLLPSPITHIRLVDWAKLDKEVSALAKRVGATAGNDKLEVVVRYCRAILGETQPFAIGDALPLCSRNIRVSLQASTSPTTHFPSRPTIGSWKRVMPGLVI